MFTFKQASDGFRQLDFFCEPVTVYFKGKSKYQTKIGAFFSIAVFIVCAVSAYQNAKKMFNKDEPLIKQYLVKIPDSEIVSIADKQFQIQLNFGEIQSNGAYYFKPIPDKFISLSAFNLDTGSKEGITLSTQTSCQVPQENLTDLERNKIIMAKCFDLSKQKFQGTPSSSKGIITIPHVSINCKANNCYDDPTFNDLINTKTIVVISTEERSLDFDDRNDPFKRNSNAVVIFTFQDIFFANLSKTITPKAHRLPLRLNEAQINDEVWRTPFNSDKGKISTKILESDEATQISYSDFNLEKLGQGQVICQLIVGLKDKKLMSIRTVYGLFDFLSEMGGLISIWMPLASFLLKLLNIPRLYLISLMQHLEPVMRIKTNQQSAQVKRFKKKFSDNNNDETPVIEEEDLVQIVYRMKQYVKFRASFFTRLFASYLPSYLHSTQTKQDILLMKKFENRMKKKLDVRRIMRNDVDLRLLLKYLMSRERYWLFCHQSSRVLSLDTDFDERDNPFYQQKSLRMLSGWKITTSLDRRLVRGILQ